MLTGILALLTISLVSCQISGSVGSLAPDDKADTEAQADQIIILMEPMMSATVDRMSSEMHNGFMKKHGDDIPDDIEIPSQSDLHNYIWFTLAQPALDSFRPELSEELDNGHQEAQKKASIWKKNKMTFRTKSHKHAQRMMARIKRRFEKHMAKASKEWMKMQALKAKMILKEKDGDPSALAKRDISLPPLPETDKSNMSFGEKLVYGFKHGFMSNHKGWAIFVAVILSMIITFPAFALGNPAAGWIAFGVIWTAWNFLFVMPILTRIFSGYWFWDDDPMA